MNYDDLIRTMNRLQKELGPAPSRRKPLWDFDHKPIEMPKEEPYRVSLEAWGRGVPFVSNHNGFLYNTPIDRGPETKISYLFGIKVYEMDDRLCPTISVQNRRHRRRRINKKWAKRYGSHTEKDPVMLKSWWLVDDSHGGKSLHLYASARPHLEKVLADVGIRT